MSPMERLDDAYVEYKKSFVDVRSREWQSAHDELIRAVSGVLKEEKKGHDT